MKKHIYQTVYEILSSGRKAVLAKIIRRTGSTPRDVGAMCIVSEDKEVFGTIGGGLMEHKVIMRCRELLEQGKSSVFRFRLTGNDLAANGMICGGEVDLYLDCLFPENPETMSVFRAASEEIEKNRAASMITWIKEEAEALENGIRILVREDKSFTGDIHKNIKSQILSQKSLNTDLSTEQQPDKQPDKQSGRQPGRQSGNDAIDILNCNFKLTNNIDEPGHSFFVEKIQLNSRLFLFGAGHVSLFVARLAKMVDFELIVIDDRPEFANKERFPEADEIIVADFEQAFNKIDGKVRISTNSYIVIVTRGHLNDKQVLKKALNTSASYIGMIGSKRKINTIYKKLMEEGISKERLETVFSPIGLEIGAETPEEIAVSIVAELIEIRSHNPA